MRIIQTSFLLYRFERDIIEERYTIHVLFYGSPACVASRKVGIEMLNLGEPRLPLLGDTRVTIQVLIVDDHAVVRQGLRMFLKTDRELHIVGEAEDGAQAVKLARELKPDVVLMDLLMPVMDGIRATETIRRELPETEVLALTSVLENASITNAIRAGAIGYLLKDTQAADLRRAIKAAAAHQVQLSPAVAAQLMRGGAPARASHRANRARNRRAAAHCGRPIEQGNRNGTEPWRRDGQVPRQPHPEQARRNEPDASSVVCEAHWPGRRERLAMSSTDDAATWRGQVALLERQVAENERKFFTLMQMARTVASTLDLEQLLAITLDQLQSLIPYSAAGIILVENDLARFVEYRGPIPRDLILSWRFPQVVAGYQLVTNSPSPVLVGDVLADKEFNRIYRESLGELYPYFGDVRSWLAAPLVARDRIIGFLRMSHTQPNFFSPQHAHIAEVVAGHAAIAIENARLLQAERERLIEVERRRQVAESLRGMLAVLNSNTPSDQVLDYVLDQACRLLDTDTATVYRLNQATQLLTPRATRNIPAEFIPKLNVRVGEAAVGQAVLQRRPFILKDFASVSISTVPEDDRASMVNWVSANFKAMLAVPVLIKEEVYGGITLYFREFARVDGGGYGAGDVVCRPGRARDRERTSVFAGKRTRLVGRTSAARTRIARFGFAGAIRRPAGCADCAGTAR